MGYGNRSIKEWAEDIHGLAKSKGWHNDIATTSERERVAVYFMNLHSEISEAWEAFRANRLNEPCDKGFV